MSEEEQIQAIREIKERRGDELVILGHHYQRESIVGVADYRGDSFWLSQKAAANQTARYIVFCGVHFMAESARVLAAPHQRVFLPNLNAGCPMADMADIDEVELAWERIASVLGEDRVVPVTYMNSSAAIKAFCGERGGVVCTSSNAARVFRWVFDRGKRLLFLPDEHLGRNTANAMGIPREEQALWDRKRPDGGLDEGALRKARVILWKGFCHVHTHFRPEHVRRARERYPDVKVVVHPECPEEVVALADAAGSTSFIVRYVEDAPPGSTVAVGTEINLVSRLAHENPDKTVVPLSRSLCHNMYKITPGALLYTLENLGEVGEVHVPEGIARWARVALERMLELA
jgi:quinolinate synthase